jgi:soluble lytic murein transglycosylase
VNRRRALFVSALIFFALGLSAAFAQAPAKAPAKSAPPQKSPAKQPPAKAQAPSGKPDATQLETLSRALREKDTAANYARLAALAAAHAKSPAGHRAALALGYRDFNKKRFDEARRWLQQAERDAVLREYALYWGAQTDRAAGRKADALAKLERLRKEHADSVMSESAVSASAEWALESGESARAREALDGYARTESSADLLWLRARAREAARMDALAAQDYLRLYTQFPLSSAADSAEERLSVLEKIPGAGAARITPEQRLARAEAMYSAARWRQARAEFEKVAPLLDGALRDRVQLRMAQCRARVGRAADALAAFSFTDPELEAERLYTLSQEVRSPEREAEMLAAVELAASRAPQSVWTEEALFAAGNYFWVALNRPRAAEYYRRVVEGFPNGKNTRAAHWRVAWVAYLERKPEAVALLEEHLARFPGSEFTRDAVYFLGRAAEREGNAAHARSFYLKLRERFPQSYFGLLAAERMREIGAGPTNAAEVLAQIPPPAPAPVIENAVPAAAKERWERARALRTIAFDSSAEQELRAAYEATGAKRLLLEAARSAHDAGRNMPGVVLARQVYPEIEARQWEDVPAEVWRTAYPLVYGPTIEKHSARAGLDPAVVTGLIRQESVFQRDAVSRAGAVGLMQLLPSTARRLARGERIAYSRARLNDPEFNIRLGTVYFRDLLRQFGSLEVALAAYNAGEHRAGPWLAERHYEELAEFIESIPFTETREYVQIVLRNAEIYRRLYERKQ